MECVNLKGFLRRARPYERWPAPLNPALRDAVVLSGVSIIVMVAILLIRPSWLPLANWAFARFPGLHTFLLTVNLLSALVYVALWFCTTGLRSGRAIWHRVALGVSLIGAIDGFIIGLKLLALTYGRLFGGLIEEQVRTMRELLNLAQTNSAHIPVLFGALLLWIGFIVILSSLDST